MSSAPEKVPIMTRFDRRLEKHGLSFGDALNIVLFLLTIASLYLAYQGVRLARVTLEDARAQATQARKDAAKAAQDQDIQFQKQMGQLKTASDAMRETSRLLRDLQGISRQQLKDMNAAEAREQKQERSRPAPHIEGTCNGRPLIHVVKGDMPPDGLIHHFVTLPAGVRGDQLCKIVLWNEGDADWKNATVTVFVDPRTELFDTCTGSTFAGKINRTINVVPGNPVEVLRGVTIPRASYSERMLTTLVQMQLSGDCTFFKLTMVVESDNLPQVEIELSVVVKPA